MHTVHGLEVGGKPRPPLPPQVGGGFAAVWLLCGYSLVTSESKANVGTRDFHDHREKGKKHFSHIPTFQLLCIRLFAVLANSVRIGIYWKCADTD